MSEHDTNAAVLEKRGSRRDFLRISALGLAVPAGLTALAACEKGAGGSAATAGAKGATNEATATAGNAAAAGMAHDSDQSGGTNAAHPATPQDARAKADAMDAMHEKGMKSFPAKTAGKGNVLLPPRM
ncbi:MAG TPA: hypothetical protein VFE05_12245 [Longimicrobiaceae bacterium]|jgi:hypothetical protein|nr:hypothetical protein [Longimicrobiaceae bacterium]